MFFSKKSASFIHQSSNLVSNAIRQVRTHIPAFTLIELLVVIVITGVLASIGMGQFNGYQEKARDAQRKSDINQIAKILFAEDALSAGNSYLHQSGNFTESGIKTWLSNYGLSLPKNSSTFCYVLAVGLQSYDNTANFTASFGQYENNQFCVLTELEDGAFFARGTEMCEREMGYRIADGIKRGLSSYPYSYIVGSDTNPDIPGDCQKLSQNGNNGSVGYGEVYTDKQDYKWNVRPIITQ